MVRPCVGHVTKGRSIIDVGELKLACVRSRFCLSLMKCGRHEVKALANKSRKRSKSSWSNRRIFNPQKQTRYWSHDATLPLIQSLSVIYAADVLASSKSVLRFYLNLPFDFLPLSPFSSSVGCSTESLNTANTPLVPRGDFIIHRNRSRCQLRFLRLSIECELCRISQLTESFINSQHWKDTCEISRIRAEYGRCKQQCEICSTSDRADNIPMYSRVLNV